MNLVTRLHEPENSNIPVAYVCVEFLRFIENHFSWNRERMRGPRRNEWSVCGKGARASQMLGVLLFSSRNFDDWWNLKQSSWLKARSKKKKTLAYWNRMESENELERKSVNERAKTRPKKSKKKKNQSLSGITYWNCNFYRFACTRSHIWCTWIFLSFILSLSITLFSESSSFSFNFFVPLSSFLFESINISIDIGIWTMPIKW